MELLTALLGAVVGAVVAFGLAEWQMRRQSRKKVVAALRGEFDTALALARDIASANSAFMDSEADSQWCEITVFPTSAWAAVISSGGVADLSEEAIHAASRAHGAILRANFAAEKIRAGRFDPDEGRRYNHLVTDVVDELTAARLQLAPA